MVTNSTTYTSLTLQLSPSGPAAQQPHPARVSAVESEVVEQKTRASVPDHKNTSKIKSSAKKPSEWLYKRDDTQVNLWIEELELAGKKCESKELVSLKFLSEEQKLKLFFWLLDTTHGSYYCEKAKKKDLGTQKMAVRSLGRLEKIGGIDFNALYTTKTGDELSFLALVLFYASTGERGCALLKYICSRQDNLGIKFEQEITFRGQKYKCSELIDGTKMLPPDLLRQEFLSKADEYRHGRRRAKGGKFVRKKPVEPQEHKDNVGSYQVLSQAAALSADHSHSHLPLANSVQVAVAAAPASLKQADTRANPRRSKRKERPYKEDDSVAGDRLAKRQAKASSNRQLRFFAAAEGANRSATLELGNASNHKIITAKPVSKTLTHQAPQSAAQVTPAIGGLFSVYPPVVSPPHPSAQQQQALLNFHTTNLLHQSLQCEQWRLLHLQHLAQQAALASVLPFDSLPVVPTAPTLTSRL